MEITYTRQGDYLLPNLTLPEQLKATDQLLWVRKMNNANQRAREVVNTEIIYN